MNILSKTKCLMVSVLFAACSSSSVPKDVASDSMAGSSIDAGAAGSTGSATDQATNEDKMIMMELEKYDSVDFRYGATILDQELAVMSLKTNEQLLKNKQFEMIDEKYAKLGLFKRDNCKRYNVRTARDLMIEGLVLDPAKKTASIGKVSLSGRSYDKVTALLIQNSKVMYSICQDKEYFKSIFEGNRIDYLTFDAKMKELSLAMDKATELFNKTITSISEQDDLEKKLKDIETELGTVKKDLEKNKAK